MKKLLALTLALIMLLLAVGCGAKAKYTEDGLVTVRNAKKDAIVFRIAEVMQDENGYTNVYVRGTENGGVCAYTFHSTGFGWDIYVAMSIETADGTSLEPKEVTPYLTGDNGAVRFLFDTKEAPKSITVCFAGQPDGGVTVPYDALKLDPAYAVSDSIVTLEP